MDGILRRLEQIADLYRRHDGQASAFAGAFGFGCPPGCGRCCDHTQTNALSLEALLIARHIRTSAPQLEAELHDAMVDADREHCVFYRQTNGELHQGYCAVYEARPLLCRSFGYSGFADPRGAVAFHLCPEMDTPLRMNVRTDFVRLIEEPFPPVMTRFQEEIERIDRTLSDAGRTPLAQAVAAALRRLDSGSD